jgi:hypothetical protein
MGNPFTYCVVSFRLPKLKMDGFNLPILVSLRLEQRHVACAYVIPRPIARPGEPLDLPHCQSEKGDTRKY